MSTMRTNQFKARLASGDTQFGLWLGIPESGVNELLAGAGFDWLVIDHEHGPYELRDVTHALQAMAPYDVSPIVRPVDGNPALLKKLCDIGAQSFIVPMIDTPDQAAAVVRAVKYPPAGSRGLGTSMARAAGWNTVPNYLERANDETCVIVQAETIAAIENLEAIASVDGVDGVFIGPSDLSASMGYLGKVSHEDVVKCVGDGLRRIRATSKFAGLLCLDETMIEHYVNCGANFVGVGVDTLLLGNSARALASKYGSGSSTESGY